MLLGLYISYPLPHEPGTIDAPKVMPGHAFRYENCYLELGGYEFSMRFYFIPPVIRLQ